MTNNAQEQYRTDVFRFSSASSANAFVSAIYFVSDESLEVACCEERDGTWFVEIRDHSWDEAPLTQTHSVQP